MRDQLQVSEISTHDDAAQVIAHMQLLFDAGRYRQALDVGERVWGSFRQWQDPGARLLLARTLYQLGMYRTSTALIFTTWRHYPTMPTVRYAWVRALFNQRGPFAALQAHDQIGPILSADTVLQANWQVLRAMIYGAYRDWDRAQALLEEAASQVADPSEYDYERSWILHQQDRYVEALALIEPLARCAGRYQRLAMQRTAGLYQLLERTDDAIVLLQEGMTRFESVDLGMQLHGLLSEQERLAEAEDVLEQVQSLIPEAGKAMGDSIRAAGFELAYRRGDYPAAIAMLGGVRGHYFRKVREHLMANHATGRQRQLAVPFIRQHHMTCAPATFAAVMRYYGHVVDHLELAAAICYDGTPVLAERRWIAGVGWAVREFELNLPNIITLIDAGCPVGFVTVEPGSAHMQAIIGYDTRRGIYLLRDPFVPRVQEILIEGAHEAYASSGPRCMVFVPPERAAWLAELPLQCADLYDRYFAVQAALDANDRESAVVESALLEREAPGHRLALWARRSLAGYDNDSAASLAVVDDLIAQFPDDLNLLVSRARLLSDLGKRAERLVFLEACRARGVGHSYLLQALAEQYAQDQRRQRETRLLLAVILRRQPTSAAALWTLAGVHWDLGEREQAFEYYRLCICIEDKVESYADSFFRAARFLRRIDEVLRYLEARVQLLGERSPNSHITLARSLDALGRSHESRHVLDMALAKHPRDQWLLTEAFDMLLATGDDQHAQTLLENNSDALPPVVRLQKKAALAGFRGAYEDQLALYGEMLLMQPGNHQAIAATMGLLAHRQSPQAAIDFIDRYVNESPFNCWLMREKLEQVERLPYAQQAPHLAAMCEHYADEDVYLLSARALMLRAEGRVDEAISLTGKAICIDAGEPWLHLRHGKALMDAGRTDEAREAFRHAIHLRVDADGVFDAFLSTYPTFEGKREALSYIHAELMRQVSLGNGILEFQQLARRYLEDAQVAKFLEESVHLRPDLWQSWIALVRFRLEINHPGEALLAADEAVTRFPLIPRVWLERAGVHRVLDQVLQAVQDLRQALAINPRYTTCSTHLVDLLELQGDIEGAYAELDRAQRLSPRYGPFYGYRAALLWRCGNRSQAMDAMVEGLRIAPFYDWGWSTLVEWAQASGCQARARALGMELATLHPDSGDLWKRCADVEPEHEGKVGFLEKALACDKRNVDFLKARCNLYVDEGNVTAARSLIEKNFSGTEKPSEILVYEAWLISCTGRRKDAITAMEQVLVCDPAQYYGWKLLARWYDEDGSGENCLRAARMLVTLHPQSSQALVSAAEYFLSRADNDKNMVSEAREYLERALRLQHGDIYTFLTLVDLYFDENNFSAIQALFDRHLVDEHDLYVRARMIRLLLASASYEEALEAAMALFHDATENNWLLFEPFSWFDAAGQGAALRARLHAAARDPGTPVHMSPLWMRAVIADSNTKAIPFIRHLRTARKHVPETFWLTGITYLLSKRGDYPRLVSVVIFLWNGSLQRSQLVWPSMIYAAVSANNWSEVRRLSSFSLSDVPALALYYCNVSWRMTYQWKRAKAFSVQAAGRPADSSRDNLRFWKQLDVWCDDPLEIDENALSSVDLNELTKAERFLYDVLMLLRTGATDPHAIRIGELRVAMRAAKEEYRSVTYHPIVSWAMFRLWVALCRRAGGGRLQRIWCGLRLLYAL